MSKKSNKRFIGGFAVALLLPLSFYVVTKILSKDKIHLPGYKYPEHVDSSVVNGKKVYDTTFHTVADVALTNQLGQHISLNGDLKGKILVVGFFFTSCPTVCPKLTGNMRLLQQAFKKDPKKETAFDTVVHLVSITVDPANDSFPVLRHYADSYDVNHDKWWFLTGNRDVIYNFARNELGLNVQPTTGGAEDMIHTQKLVLIDRDRKIRGYYDGLDSVELRRCADDVILLSIEKKRKKK